MAANLCRSVAFICFVLGLSITVIYASHACGLCPAGFFLKHCANSTTPVCVKCPEGSYISVANNFPRCHRCSGCFGRNNIIVKACNGTHDSVCRCKKGYWYDSGALYCTPCKSCGRGRGVVKECSYNSDTVCRKCVKHETFSPSRGTEGCRNCKKCSKGERIAANCTRRIDTRCEHLPGLNKPKYVTKLKNKSKEWPSLGAKTTETVTTDSPTDVDRETPDSDADELGTSSTAFQLHKTQAPKENGLDATLKLVLIISGCCVCFIMAVLAVACVSRRRKQRLAAPPRTQAVSSLSKPKPVIQQNRLSSTPLVSNGSTDKLFRDVPYTLTDHLSRHLNPKGRWKSLAGHLGFTGLDIESFNLQPTSATCAMLYEWGQRRESTLYALFETLKTMKWETEADIVRTYL